MTFKYLYSEFMVVKSFNLCKPSSPIDEMIFNQLRLWDIVCFCPREKYSIFLRSCRDVSHRWTSDADSFFATARRPQLLYMFLSCRGQISVCSLWQGIFVGSLGKAFRERFEYFHLWVTKTCYNVRTMVSACVFPFQNYGIFLWCYEKLVSTKQPKVI